MVDLLEYNLRRVASNNVIYCAERCEIFNDIMNQDLTVKQTRNQTSCFEKCLGKHSDSLEVGLDTLR